MGCDIDRAKGDVVATLLTIERVINMLVQQLSFNRQPIVVPLLLKMYESPLSGAEPVVLYPRQHKHIVFAIHYYISSSTVMFAGKPALSIVTV